MIEFDFLITIFKRLTSKMFLSFFHKILIGKLLLSLNHSQKTFESNLNFEPISKVWIALEMTIFSLKLTAKKLIKYFNEILVPIVNFLAPSDSVCRDKCDIILCWKLDKIIHFKIILLKWIFPQAYVWHWIPQRIYMILCKIVSGYKNFSKEKFSLLKLFHQNQHKVCNKSANNLEFINMFVFCVKRRKKKTFAILKYKNYR